MSGEQQGDYHYGQDESQDFVDRSKIDFDPEEGLFSGTAVDGTSEIPGPHEKSEGGDDLDAEGMQKAAADQAKEAGANLEDTPAAKSPVARAAEKDNTGADEQA